MRNQLLKNWRRLALSLAAVLLLSLATPLAAARTWEEELPVAWDLSAAEMDYIRQKDVLRVALVSQWHPLSSRTERNNTPKGLVVDILHHFQRHSGIPISYTMVDSYREAIRLTESGETDVAAIVMEYDYAKPAFDLQMSSSYLTSQLVVVHSKGTEVMNQPYYLLAQVDGFPRFSQKEKVFPMSFDTQEDCLIAVRSGHADMMVSDIYSGFYYIQQFENRDLEATPVNAHALFRFGVNKSEDAALVRLLDRAIDCMGRDTMSHSLSYSPVDDTPSLWDFIYYYPFEIICIVIALAFLLIMVSTTYVHVRARRSISSQGYEQSYMMLADNFGQAGLSYDYQEDRLTIFGQHADTLALPRELENFSTYLEREDRAVSTTKEELQKILYDGMAGTRCDTELSCRLRDGQWYHFRLFYTVISTTESYRRPIRLVGCLVSAESDFQQKEELIQKSLYDQLTGLRNRFGAEQKLQRIYANGADTVGDLLLLIDIDHFKLFNDTYGHECGDEVLHTIGHLLRVTFRGEDMLCRWGGDEFMLYLPGAADHIDAVMRRCEAIREKLRFHQYQDRPLPITLSIGGARVDGRSLSEVRTAADKALYIVKEQGRDGVHILDEKASQQ